MVPRCSFFRPDASIKSLHDYADKDNIGVYHPAIVWELPHVDVFPAFQHFSENVPNCWLYFETQIFLIIVIILGARKKLCA